MGNTILLADKSITIQKIVELTFSDDQFEIRCVNDGQSALEAIPQIRPDIILADISLPVRSGYEICEILRTSPEFASFAQTPVILLAGIYETMDEERARAVEEKVREVGANDLLSKPFDPQLLTTKVKDLISVFSPPMQSTQEAVTKTQDIFAESLHPEEDTITGPMHEMSGESYDTEKTMMLPGPPIFSNNMFAEAPPFEMGEADLDQETVNIGSVSPTSEPIFEEAELQSAPPASEVAEESAPSMEFSDSSFSGREESEFSFESPDETAASREMFFVPQGGEPVFDAPAEDRTAPQPSMIVPEGDEPFGDVFGESPETAQWNTSASEEDSPFGLPEPPPAPPVQEELVQEVQEALSPVADVENTGPLTIPPEILWTSQPVETPLVEEHVEEPAKEELEEIDSSAEVNSSFRENTWSRERSLSGERTAEELFGSEISAETVPAVEESEELQPDVNDTSATQVISSVSSVEPPQTSQAVPAAAPEITDELINKIADRVVAKLSERIVSEIVWQVVPDLAEKMIRRELEKLHAGEE
ncbi:MAG TPA: response regulator [Acidobacteriota bacterium]|nr:response regulator [Acidobacteriota bacterium]